MWSAQFPTLCCLSPCQNASSHVRSKWLSWEPSHLQLPCDSSKHAEDVVEHGTANVNIRPQSNKQNSGDFFCWGQHTPYICRYTVVNVYIWMVIWMSWIILDLENYKFSSIRLHGSVKYPGYQPKELTFIMSCWSIYTSSKPTYLQSPVVVRIQEIQRSHYSPHLGLDIDTNYGCKIALPS